MPWLAQSLTSPGWSSCATLATQQVLADEAEHSVNVNQLHGCIKNFHLLKAEADAVICFLLQGLCWTPTSSRWVGTCRVCAGLCFLCIELWEPPPLAAYLVLCMQAISDICKEANAWLCIDETYEDFLFDGRQKFTVSGPHVVHIFSFSKAYGLMGWVRCTQPEKQLEEER